MKCIRSMPGCAILSKAILTFACLHIYNDRSAGEEARQTAFETIQVPGYTHRSDITAHALTLQLPLEGKLLRGGVTGVIKTKDSQWLHCQQHGAAPDFFISTREVRLWSALYDDSEIAEPCDTQEHSQTGAFQDVHV